VSAALARLERYLAAQNFLPAPRGQFRFLFETADDESCPHGGAQEAVRDFVTKASGAVDWVLALF